MKEIERGMRVYWKGANRTETGIVEAMRIIDLKGKPVRREYDVALDNGKHMIINEKSIKL